MNSLYDPEELAILKDKLQAWPGEMALTFEDVVNLIRCVENYRQQLMAEKRGDEKEG